MTTDEVRSVLAVAKTIDPAAHVALRLAAVAGLRRGEIAALQWTDFGGRTLTVDSALVVDRNGDETRIVDTPTKTGGRRTITLDAETIGLVEALRHEREAFGPWLCGPDADPPHPDRIGWWWQRARKLSGIAPHWRLHDLRHWSATTAIGGGHDVRTVANRLGHANAAMTLGVYAHAVPAADAAFADAIALTLDSPA